jgi:hypothetical protein
MKLHVIGIDLGKTVFHLVGLGSTGRAVTGREELRVLPKLAASRGSSRSLGKREESTLPARKERG